MSDDDGFMPISTAPQELYKHHMVRAPGRNRVEGYLADDGLWHVAGQPMDPQPVEWQPLWDGTGYTPTPINIQKHDPNHQPPDPLLYQPGSRMRF